MASTSWVADHPDLPHGQEGSDPLSLRLQIRHLPASRHADPELLAGPGQPAADDPGDAVVDRGQLGMATGQRPPPAQVRPEQRAGQRLPGPGDHRHQERGGHDQPLGTVPTKVLAQPQVGARHEGDEGEFEPVGPGRAEDAVE
jgi:hypothetical protein